MNIFRKSYTVADIMSSFPRDFSSLGFNYLNGKSINPNDNFVDAFNPEIVYNPPTTDNPKADSDIYIQKGIKWKYDTSASKSTDVNHIVLMSPSTKGSTELNRICTYGYYKGGTELEPQDWNHYDEMSVISTDEPFQFTFIPLINNGFILISFTVGYNGNFNPTPPILSWHEGRALSSTAYSFLIGFKTNIYKQNPYSYIISTGSEYQDSQISLNLGTYTEKSSYGNNLWNIYGKSIPLNTYIDNTQNLQYTDVNNHICTLVKMPVFSTYLDNVFICTTSPFADGVEGKTFSFEGRNFIGMYNNLVLELPRN